MDSSLNDFDHFDQLRVAIRDVGDIRNARTNQVVSSRRFQVMVSAPGNHPYSGVLAANKAANIMSSRVARFVVQSIIKKF